MKNQTFENKEVPAIRDLWSGGRWFYAHPEKVCGTVNDTFDKWGKAVKSITGSLDDALLSIYTETKASEFPYSIVDAPKVISNEKLLAAITKTEEESHDVIPSTGYDMYGMDEMLKLWHPEVTETDIKIYLYYQRNRAFSSVTISSTTNAWSKYAEVTESELKNWIDSGKLCFDGTDYVPYYIFYSGNIYEKINVCETNKSAIANKIGEINYNSQLDTLKLKIPKELKLDAPESERLFISPFDPFVNKHTINQLADGTIFEDEEKLLNAYTDWLQKLPKEDFANKSNFHNVMYHYILNERFPNDTPNSEKIKTKRLAQLDGIALFQRFMSEMVTNEDKRRLEYLWNAEFNNFLEIDYKKIPVGFEINKYFGTGRIDPKPALWEGIKFIGANGSGIIAFDVGVGKTMTAILAVAQAIYTGQCKRPLIIVPNPTYTSWMHETVGKYDENGVCVFQGILPQYKDRINDYYNLGVNHKHLPAEKPVKDYTITFLTYSGLENLGFSSKMKGEMRDQLVKILNQGTKEREHDELINKIDEMLGNASAKTIYNFDDFGFDYVVVDEAHNFKKIFTQVKGREDEESKQRGKVPYLINSGKFSNSGVKLFLASQYILRRNNMRNVVLLTATPFTNSPLEIYSMLSLVAFQDLQRKGIVNLIDFFDKFINESNEQVITVKGKLEEKNVIKTFQNKLILQNIIFSYVLYKTGEEANVKRPIKLLYPYLKDKKGIILEEKDKVETTLIPTPDQLKWLRLISAFANGDRNEILERVPQNYYKDGVLEDGVKILLAMSLARACTISPYMLRFTLAKDSYEYLYSEERPTYKQFIQSSPKLLYVMECIRTVRQHHINNNEPCSGQVIYMNIATDYFQMIKEYLVREIGFDAAEVGIMIGGMNSDKKDAVKDAFNEGKVKVLIGSGTIKEGVNLQMRSTCLYVCNMDWNPTDFIQVQGRIWRQKNKFSYVRIVLPLVENSMDVFVFQKLDEKTSRINDIWKRNGRSNVLDVDELSPEELKTALMTDPKERAFLERRKAEETIKFEKVIVDNYIKELGEAKMELKAYNSAAETIEQYYIRVLPILHTRLQEYKDERLELEGQEQVETKKKELDKKITSLADLLSKEVTQKTKYAVIRRVVRIKLEKRGVDYEANRMDQTIDKQITREQIIERVQRNILAKNGLTLLDDIQPVIDGYVAESTAYNEQLIKVNSSEYLEALISKYDKAQADSLKQSKPIEERVEEFTKHNYLLSCLVDIDSCDLESSVIQKLEPKRKEKAAPDKSKRIRIAKAIGVALILQLQLIQQE